MARDLKIRAAEAAEWQRISQVLDSCGLPHDDIDLSSRLFHIALLHGKVVGCACAERYDKTVVVRSVAILPEYSDRRIVMHLVGAVLMRACAEGCTKAVLVTAKAYSAGPPCKSSLASMDAMPEELELSKKLIRRFGGIPRAMCRQ
ncbi:GNAT family N-acetyltransferase [Cupriavidus sp. CP313]